MAKETLKNNNTVEIVEKNGITFSSETVNGGFADEKKIFSFSGRVLKNKPTLIGELTLTAAENKRFRKNPGIKPSSDRDANIKSYLKTTLKNTTKDSNGNVISYTYDLVYTGKEDVSASKKIKYNLSDEVKTIKNRINGLKGVEFGGLIISEGGEKRVITVVGDPETTFKLSVLELTDSYPSASAVSTAGYDENQILSTTQKSILSKRNYNDVVTLTGVNYDVISKNLKFSTSW